MILVAMHTSERIFVWRRYVEAYTESIRYAQGEKRQGFFLLRF